MMRPGSQFDPKADVSLNTERILAPGGTSSSVAQPLPDDSALPGSALLSQSKLRNDVMRGLLNRWLDPNSKLLDSFAVPCRYVPGKRCNFQVELLISNEPGAAIERRRVASKIYAKDHGARVHEMLQDFQSHGFSGGRFLVPQPIAYDPRWKLLVHSWVDGQLLRSLILDDDSEVFHRIREAADWLLKFHQSGVTTGRHYTFQNHLDTLTTQGQSLAKIYPQADSLIEDLLRRIDEQGNALSGWTPGPTHRDFSPDHLLFSEGRITGLDFDEFRQYDPMFDVAHFMAHLRLLGLRYFGDHARFDDLAETFQTEYRASAGDFSEARVHFYMAVAYFKIAYIVALVVRPAAWREAVDMFLRQAGQELKCCS